MAMHDYRTSSEMPPKKLLQKLCTTNRIHGHIPQLAEIVLQAVVKINILCQRRTLSASGTATVIFTVNNL